MNGQKMKGILKTGLKVCEALGTIIIAAGELNKMINSSSKDSLSLPDKLSDEE